MAEHRWRRDRTLAAVIAWMAAGSVLLTGPAKAATPSEATTPCAGTLWGACAYQSAPGGYRYRYSYKDGMVAPVPVPPAAVTEPCDVNCPVDPAAVCDLLTAVRSDPVISGAERATYDGTISDCGSYLLVDNPIPMSQVQTALAATMRAELLPKPSIIAGTWNPHLTGSGFLFHPGGPSTYTGDTTESARPLAAAIHAAPQYHWDFGDGTAAETSNMDLATRDRDGGDVTHHYSRPGVFRVTLTVTWAGTFVIPGVTQPLPLQPARLTAATDVFVGSIETIGGYAG
ncbi:PKD domain-containing protein [Frankia sp. AgKG'84/4]|uniref:PKD domain-containing protein n=1 Tax=Frankia sp. AgKG'84/4 TaxID=573490 RepID=UPI002029E675|nr:PKD domain-containing protein [Frankia sp. AgKG'84/4]MCL9796023.1 PKD domain-containing protein [Frankia sp. AgKG'84/4]